MQKKGIAMTITQTKIQQVPYVLMQMIVDNLSTKDVAKSMSRVRRGWYHYMPIGIMDVSSSRIRNSDLICSIRKYLRTYPQRPLWRFNVNYCTHLTAFSAAVIERIESMTHVSARGCISLEDEVIGESNFSDGFGMSDTSSITYLDLSDGSVFEEGSIKKIKKLLSVRELILKNCNLYDHDVWCLKDRALVLEKLDLSDNLEVTVLSIPHFKKMGSLKHLVLSGSGFDLQAVARLREERRDLSIVF
jgi:hypothetical protein